MESHPKKSDEILKELFSSIKNNDEEGETEEDEEDEEENEDVRLSSSSSSSEEERKRNRKKKKLKKESKKYKHKKHKKHKKRSRQENPEDGGTDPSRPLVNRASRLEEARPPVRRGEDDPAFWESTWEAIELQKQADAQVSDEISLLLERLKLLYLFTNVFFL